MHPSIDPFSRSDMSENIKRAKHVRENQEQNRKSKVCAILGNPGRRCIVRELPGSLFRADWLAERVAHFGRRMLKWMSFR